MNATVFELDYWSLQTKRMNLDWMYVVHEMLALLVLSVLASIYAWLIENDVNVYPLINNKRKCNPLSRHYN